MERTAMGHERKYMTQLVQMHSSTASKLILVMSLVVIIQLVKGEHFAKHGHSDELHTHDHNYCKHQHPKPHEVSNQWLVG